METVLRTQGLCKHYRRFQALDGLDMEVPKGAIYGLVGKNGAGKTTLIRVICGLQAPTAGSYSLYGATLGEPRLNRARRRMGAVVETPSLYPDMTPLLSIATTGILGNIVFYADIIHNLYIYPSLLRMTK